MASDKIDWHAGADNFPKDVAQKNAGTHIGMFIDWARSRGLMSRDLAMFSPMGERLLRWGLISGRTFIILFCDYVFSSGDHLNKEGHTFAEAYYDRYLADFDSLFAGRYKTIYHVRYSRSNRRAVAKLLDERFRIWQATSGKR